MLQKKRSDRPVGEAGRYLSDEQFYRFYLELVLNKESVLTASARAGINRNTGYKIAAQFDALAPGQRHPRILEIEEERENTVAEIAWLDPTRRGKSTSVLQSNLDALVIGQTAAKDAIVENYELYTAGLVVPNRPIGSFLFLGPTGSGKTLLVESLATSLAGNPRAMIKVDCAEFQHSHEIAKLIGSPPGYLGHRETHPLLSQERLNLHHTDKMKLSFVLFDEIEKASNAIWNLLLGILDKAILTLGDNRIVDFSQTMIFLTSNLGARDMANLGAPKWFNLNTQVNAERSKFVGIGAAKKHFTVEFYNRLDYVVVFDPLTQENMEEILKMRLREVQSRIALALAHPFFLRLTDEARKELLNRGFDAKYGARALNRTLAKEIERPIAGLINSGQIVFKRDLVVDFKDGKFLFGEPRGGSLAA